MEGAFTSTPTEWYSYLLPGVGDIPLDEARQAERERRRAERERGDLTRELGDLKFDMDNREVISRCEDVIAWSLKDYFSMDESAIAASLPEMGPPGGHMAHRISIHQLLYLVKTANIAQIDPASVKRLEDASLAFYQLKASSHIAVHRRELSQDQLAAVMHDIGTSLSDPRLEDADRNRYRSSFDWVYQNHAEYLRNGDYRLIPRGPLFPVQRLYLGGGEETAWC